MSSTISSTPELSCITFSRYESQASAHDTVRSQQKDVEKGVIVDEMSEQVSPRADGGKEAWLFLAGCFVFEALIWGFPFSFGVFQSYYSNHAAFSENSKGIANIGTCSTGVMYFFAPISLFILETFPQLRRACSISGLAIVVTALVASSFSTAVWHLIFTQGVLYAIGGSLLYTPTAVYLDQWFIKKKGLAFGIMWAGVGTSGLIFPFLLTALLDKYGFRTTLRAWALTLLFLCTPLIYFVKPRLPSTSPAKSRQPISYKCLKSRAFLFLQIANILESLGFFLPSIYLPTYASSINLRSIDSTIILAILNLFSVFGAIALGHLTDRLQVNTVIAISSIGTVSSVFFLWGFAASMPMLVCFAATYGVFAGGFSAIWMGMAKEVIKDGDPSLGLTLMGMFSAGRGIGAVASGPLSELLLTADLGHVAMAGYGSQYGVLIVFTGISAFCGLICFGAGKR